MLSRCLHSIPFFWYHHKAFKIVIPPLGNQFISLIKDTSLTTIISFLELTYRSKIIYSMDWAFVLPMYVIMAFLYWVICHTLSKASKRFEVDY